MHSESQTADEYDGKKRVDNRGEKESQRSIERFRKMRFQQRVLFLQIRGFDCVDYHRGKKSNDWSGKYAPGGSSKMASGRAFYNALNQLAGHFSFNGLAPLPKSRLEVVETNIAKTRELIAEGR